MQRLMWPQGHPYHVPVIGTIADVEGFEIEGVRAFWERHYRPKNAVLAVVGNVDAEEAMSALSDLDKFDRQHAKRSRMCAPHGAALGMGRSRQDGRGAPACVHGPVACRGGLWLGAGS